METEQTCLEKICTLEKANRVLRKKLERTQTDRIRLEETNEKKEFLLRKVIDDLNQAEQQLQMLIEGTAATTGQDFFSALVKHIATALDVPYAVVTERVDGRLETLAFWAHGSLQPTFSYHLTQTPCERTLQDGRFYCECSVQQRFSPVDLDLVGMGAESYLGIALHGIQGGPIGNLCILHQQPIQNPQRAEQILRVFAARATAELERQRAITSLEHLNQNLESQVIDRTAALEEREQLLETVLDTFPLSVFWKDRNLVYQGGNRNFLKDVGLGSSADLVGKTDDDLPWDPEEAKIYLDRDRQILASDAAMLGITETRSVHGNLRWLETNKLPLHNRKGEVVGVLGTYQDITHRKQSEEQLRQLSTRLNLAVKSGGIGIWDWNIPKDQLNWDRRMYELYGASPGQFTNTYETWLSQVHPEDRAAAEQITQQALAGACDYDMEFRVIHSDGTVHIIKANGLIQRNSRGEPQRMIGVNYDITEQKQAAMDLQRAKEQADRANRAKSEFLANMSHELRTPLNAILGFSQVMSLDQALTAEHQDYLGIINRSGEHLLALLNNILEMSKIETGRITLNKTHFDLHLLLSRLEEMFRLDANGKGVQLEFHQAANVPKRVQGDEGKLRQILINLVGNAVKFTSHGRVTLGVRFAGSGLIFNVEDTGPGISPEEQAQLFTVFGQTKAGRDRQDGTGLGLHISQKFAHLMGGDIAVQSKVGVGTTFRLQLPIQVTPGLLDLDPAAPPVISGLEPGQPAYRILVVDDQPHNSQLLVALLEVVGFATQATATGPTALEIWDQWHPHLVWMDLRMPGMSGYDITQAIRAREEAQARSLRTIIIAVTANAFAEERAKSLDAGCDDFVSKPFKDSLIYDKMAQHLGVRYLYRQGSNQGCDFQERMEPRPQDPRLSIQTALQASQVPIPIAELSGLSPVWIHQLYSAALCADSDAVLNMLTQLDQTSELRQKLMQLANTFQFEQILAAIESVMESTEDVP